MDSSRDRDFFSERLRTAREFRRLSQVGLSKKCGLPSTTICHFESGSRKPSFNSLRRLAEALAVTTDYLLGLADTPLPSMEADALFRQSQNLSDRHRDIARRILEILAAGNDDSGSNR